MNSGEHIDPEAMRRLRRLGGEAFLAKMIELFLGYSGEKLAEARRAAEAGDWPGVAAAVHPLKSSAGNVGAVHLQQLATEAEQCAKDGKPETVLALLGEMHDAFEVIRPVLEAEKAKGSSANGGAGPVSE